MKTILKSLAAIHTWVVALAVTLLSGATLASELYSNSFASSDAMVPSGTYGELIVPDPGFKATKFTGAFDSAATISGGRGSFANVIAGGGTVHTHTISGWFKVDSLDCTVYAALANVGKWGAVQNGYKVYCTSEGKLLIGKVNSDTCAWDPATGQLTVPTELKAGTWYYLTIAITVNSSKVATAVVFVNGTKVFDEATTFKVNLNGDTCQRFFIGAGVTAAGLYADSDAVTDAETIKGWAVNPAAIAKIYSNPLASNGATVTPGTYGDIVVPGTGFEATKFARTEAIIGGNGSFASISSGGDIRTHTVSGWFMTESLDSVVYAAVNDIATAVWGPSQTGYRVYCTGEGKLQIGECHSETYAAQATAGYMIEVPTELKANTWYYLTVAITHSANARTVTVKVFVNGDLVFDDASKTFKINVNGSLCERFCVGAGVSAAGLYIDSTAVSDAEVIKGWATNPELVEAAPANALVAMPTGYTQPNALFVPRGAYANTGLEAKDVTGMVTTFDVNGEDETYSGAMDESGAYPFAKDQDGSAAFADDKGMLHFRRGKIYEGEALVRYFVPCCKDDGETGFWDLVEGKFYGNEGTGRFAHSFDGDLRLSWIQASGKQYIDTGVLPTYNTKAELDIKLNSAISGNIRMFGVNIANYIRFQLYCYGSYFQCRIGAADNSASFKIGANNNRTLHTLEMDGTTAKYTCGDTSQSVALSTTATKQASLYLFTTRTDAADSAPGNNCSATLYGAKISEGGTPLRDFVPARSADGIVGLIDLANENKFYPNSGTGNGGATSMRFTWGGIAYTIDGTTLKLHEGTLAAEDLADYTAVEKVDIRYELNAGAVTAYAIPLTLSEGVFALTDGEAKTVSVNGKLTINGGVTLKIDAANGECDNFDAQSLDLSDATADNPIVIEIVSAVGMDWSAGATLIANTGLADGPCTNVRIANNDELQLVVKNGDLMIQMKSSAAHWTGAVDNDPTKPGNWEEGKVPTAETIVYFSGASVPSIPAGTSFAAKSLALDVTLADNCDWRGLDPTIPVTGKIDLNGYCLTVADLTGDYEITDTTDTSADDVTPGELHVDVASGKTVANTTVTLSGALKFVKEGEGIFAVTKAETYAGGTDVKGGTLRCDGYDVYPGKLSTPVTVYEGAVYDIGNIITEWQTQVVLAGGTLANKLKDHSYGGKPDYYGQNPVIKVVDDSTISVDYTLGMVAGGYKPTTLDLGGNKLEVSIANGMIFVLDNTEVSAGLLKVTGAGTLMFKETSLRAAEADFDLECGTVSVQVPAEVHDLTMRSGTTVSGNGVISVNGSYRPLGATAPKVLLKDGASFDLSTFSEVFDLAGTTTTYADNATILINVGERELKRDEKVIAWSALPANVGGLTFKFVGTNLGGETVNAVVRDDGVYYPDVTTIVKATWTGAAEDGDPANAANWTCENALEKVVPGVLPGASTVVYLNGEIAFNVKSGATFTAGSLVANDASLKGDADWSGLSSAIPVTGKLDLNGHNLIVSELAGNCEITDSSATVYERLEYIQSNNKQCIDTKVVGKPGLTVTADFAVMSGSGTDCILVGSRQTSGGNNRFYPIGYDGSKFRFVYAQTWQTAASAFTVGQRYFVESSVDTEKQELKIDGTVAVSKTLTNVPTTTYNMFLFDGNVAGGRSGWGSTIRLYGSTITVGENLVRDFVPVKRVSDGAIGLLDLAHLGSTDSDNPEFYENKETTAFTAGATTGYLYTRQGSSELASPGELHVNVEEGETVEGYTLQLTGAIKLVKEGEGTFAVTKAQTYIGGTDVKGGTLKCGENIYPGKSLTPITVYEGGTFDVGGLTSEIRTVLAGGTLANTLKDHISTSSGVDWNAQIPIFKVVADSDISAEFTLGLVAGGYAQTTLDLGGNELAISIASGKNFILDNTEVKAGTLKTTGEGQLYISRTSCRAAEADFDLGSAKVSVNVATEVHDLTVRSGTTVSGGSVITVNGTYRPLGATAPNVLLKDGASLDLSGLDATLDLTGTTTTFEDNATITVVPGSKVGKIVSWAAVPENNVKFVMDRKYGRLEVQADGLYRHTALAIIIR